MLKPTPAQALGTKPPAAGAGADALLLPPNTPPPKGAGAALPGAPSSWFQLSVESSLSSVEITGSENVERERGFFICALRA